MGPTSTVTVQLLRRNAFKKSIHNLRISSPFLSGFEAYIPGLLESSGWQDVFRKKPKMSSLDVDKIYDCYLCLSKAFLSCVYIRDRCTHITIVQKELVSSQFNKYVCHRVHLGSNHYSVSHKSCLLGAERLRGGWSSILFNVKFVNYLSMVRSCVVPYLVWFCFVYC